METGLKEKCCFRARKKTIANTEEVVDVFIS
jgi:hypothetical protein